MAVVGSKVEGDGRVMLETSDWATVSTFLSLFCVSSLSLVFFFLYSLPFPLWLSMSYYPPLSLLVYVAHRCHGKGNEAVGQGLRGTHHCC